MFRIRVLIGGLLAVGLVLLLLPRALEDAWELSLYPSFLGLRNAIAELRDSESRP